MQSRNERQASKLSTPFVRIPTVDWSRVRCGAKREFRTHPSGGNLPWARNMPYLPMLAVAWCQAKVGARQQELMLVTDAWVEPLHAIGEEGIRAEGFETRAEFKRYWIARHKRGGWRALSRIVVIRLRPLEEEVDLEEQRDKLLEHFYGEWLT